jgi:type VII secretion protein EccB
MPTTTKDNLQVHRFMNRRVRAALLEGDAESTARPLARLGAGTYAGIFVTIALLAIVGIIGVIRPGGSTAWQQPGAFIVESETGARYAYLDGVLHPVLNYSSAKLLLGDQLHVVNVSVRSLESAPRGAAIGIGMAPDSLPDAGHVVGTDWSVCAAGNTAGGAPLRTALFPGRLADGTAMGTEDAYLARTDSGRNYLITSGHAFEIADQWLPAVDYKAAQALPVDDDFVAALPAGEPIAPPEVAGLGQSGPPLPGSVEPVVIGSIFADRVNAYYLMTQTGLASLTPLQAGLLLADPRLAQAYAGSNPSPLPISQAQITGGAVSPLPNQGSGQPAPSVAPALTSWPVGDQQICVRYGQQQVPDIVVGPTDPDAREVDGLVQLPTGSGALVAARPSPGAPGTTVYLVTDTGVRYPVAGPKALEQLGLSGLSIAQLPRAVVDLLPEGPLLDPAAAALPAS